MSDEDDLFGGYNVLGYLLVVRVFLGNAFTFVVSFLAVNQMMMETKGVIRFYTLFTFRPAVDKIVIYVSNMMVDDHDHSPDSGFLGGHLMGSRPFQTLTQARYLLHRKIMAAGALEETSL